MNIEYLSNSINELLLKSASGWDSSDNAGLAERLTDAIIEKVQEWDRGEEISGLEEEKETRPAYPFLVTRFPDQTEWAIPAIVIAASLADRGAEMAYGNEDTAKKGAYWHRLVKETLNDNNVLLEWASSLSWEKDILPYATLLSGPLNYELSWPKAEKRIVADLSEPEEQIAGLDPSLKRIARYDPVYPYLSSLPGMEPELAASMLSLIDFSLSRHVSSLWKFAGFSARDSAEYSYCKPLKELCLKVAPLLVSNNDAYKQVYLQAREYYLQNRPDWTPDHQQQAAMRKVIKTFLAHLWIVGRSVKNLPVTPPIYSKTQVQGHEANLTQFGWLPLPRREK